MIQLPKNASVGFDEGCHLWETSRNYGGFVGRFRLEEGATRLRLLRLARR